MGALGSFAGSMFATKGRVIAVSVLAALLLSAALFAFRLAYADTGSSRSIAALGTPVSENFDSLSNSAASSTLPQGFVFSESGSSANTLYGVNNGSSATGDTYSYGTASAADRALGSLRSGSLNSTIGARFVNNTGSAINSLTISYTGEQWRLGTAERSDKLGFSYSVNAASLTSGTYTDVGALDFSSPETANTGIKDGNTPDHRRNVGHTIKGLDIPAGATFFIRWTDSDASGSDDGLAVDDFSLTARANASPVANNDPAYAVNEGQALNVSSANGVLANDTDADGDTLKAVREGSPSNGGLTLSSNGSFIFTPGAEYFGSDAFTYRADDEQATANLSNLATATLTVRPVNDAPSFALPASPNQTAAEDAPAQSVPGFASNISKGPANESDQDVNFEVKVLDGGGEPITGDSPLFTADGQPSITGTNSQDPGALTYTPKPDANGKVAVRVVAEDTGGTGNGGVNRSSAQTFAVTASPDNDRPTAADGDGTIAEDGGPANETLAINLRELVEDGETTDENLTYNVTAPTSGGTLTQNEENGNPVPGMYTFDPAPDFNGAVAIPYTVADEGDPSGCTTAEPPAQGCDDEILASEGKTFTVNVTSVNDAPVTANDEKNVAENGTLAFPAGNLLVNDEPGPATALDELDETTGQSLSVNDVGPAENGTASLDNNGTPSDKSDDVITFEPDENYNSFTDPDDPAGFEYEVCDNGGIPECDIGSVAVEVAPVNARPNAVSVTPAVVDEADTGNEVEINLSDAVDDVETANADLAYEIEAPTPEQGTLEPKMDGGDPVPGVYIFDPAQDYNTGAGTLELSYTATDRGDPDDCDDTDPDNAADNCDGPESASDDLTIAVEPINDAPSFTAGDDEIVLEDSKNPDDTGQPENTHVVSGWATDIGKGADDIGNEDDQSLAFSATTDNEDLFAELPSIDEATGDLTYELAEHQNGAANVTVALADDGPGGEDGAPDADGNDNESAAETFTITVRQVNDAPTSDDETATTDEDTPKVIDVLDGDEPGPATDEASQTLIVDEAHLADNQPDNGEAVVITQGIIDADPDGLTEDDLGKVLYTPNSNYNNDAVSLDTFTYQACDDGQSGNLTNDTLAEDSKCDKGNVSVAVTPINDPPVANGASRTMDEDDILEVNVFDDAISDTDDDKISSDIEVDRGEGGATLTFINATQGDHGTVRCTPNGACTYTPDENYNGDDSFGYTVRDNAGATDTATISISVASVDDDPIANDDPSEDDTLETNRGESLENIDVLANDADADDDIISIFDFTDPVDENGDSAGTLTKNNDDTFTFTPNGNYFGTATFTYRAKDFRGTDENDPEPDGISDESATVTITVIDDNDPPVAVNDAYSVDEGADLTTDDADGETTSGDANDDGILANDTDEDDLFVADADPDAAGVQPESGPENGTLELAEDGTFTYTPNDDFYGTDEFIYKATDRRGNEALSNEATVAITVENVKDNPVANNDPGNDGEYEVNEDGTLTANAGGGLIANDADADNLTGNPNTGLTVADADPDAPGIQAESGPSHGTLIANPNGSGSFTYTPNANYNGPDSFIYKAKDAEGNLSDNEATVAISVSPVADAPIARIDTATAPEDTPFLINVLANDGNPDGGPLSATVADGPDHGTASVIAEDGADKNKIRYTPNPNFHGSDDLTYEVCDSGNRCDQAQARITVAPVNDAPIANDDSYATDDDETLVGEAPGLLANDTDVDNENNSNAGLRVFQPGQPTYGNLTANEDGSFEYTFDPESADNDFTGTDSFIYAAKDGGEAESQPATVTIEINTVNKKPTATADEYTVLEDGALAADNTGDPAINGVLFNDTDPENDTLEARLESDASHGTLELEADGTFVYSPDENYNGDDSFTYRADDGGAKNNLSDEATVSITVAPDNDAPTADSASRATDEDGDGVSIDLSSLVDDIETPNGELDYELAAANGASLSGSILTYKPADNFNTGGGDPVEIEYTVADKGDPNDCDDADENCDGVAKTAENTVDITVRPVNDRPAAGDKSDTTTPEDTPLTIDVFEGAPPLASDIEKTRDEPGATLAVVRTTNGEHGDVSRDGSAITYTPDADYNGGDSFTYTVRDEAGEEATGEISVSVSGVNKPPTATADSFTVAEDGTLTGNILTNDTDSDGDALTAELVEGPENAAETNGFTLNPNGSFTYKPKPNFHGDDSFSYEVCDAGEPCAEATVSIAITPVNDAPVANNDPSNDTSYEATEDGTLTVDDGGNDVLANDTDADGDELSAVKVADPEHGTARLAENGSFVYEPDENFSGSDSFTYRSNDGSLSSEVAVVSITVSTVNDKPVPTDDAKSTSENTPLVFPASQLTANDRPAPAAAGDEQSQTLTVTEVGSSEHGAVSLDNGEITFTPAPNYNGPASFEYTVCDDGSPQACAVMEATVNVAISAVNSAPVAGSISRTMDEGGAPTTVNLADHTSDDETADGDLTFALVQSPTAAQGAAILDGSSLTFTPNPNFDGTVNLRYSVTDDGDGDAPAKTAEAALTITVNSVNDAPTAGDADATVREDTPANINVLAEAADSDGDDLEVIIVSQPGKGSATVNSDGTVRYSPRTNLNGPDSFTYKVSDGDLESGEATVSIAITAVNDAPSAASDTARTTINRAVSANVLANDTDPDGDNLSASVAGQPAKGRVVKNSNGALKYTPPRNFVGNVSFTYRASDGNGGSDTATVRITVARR